jgi:hypothetical protein
MGLPNTDVTLTPAQVAELNRGLSELRHNVNNHLALIVTSLELVQRKPEAAERLLDNARKGADKIRHELQGFSQQCEQTLGILPDEQARRESP